MKQALVLQRQAALLGFGLGLLMATASASAASKAKQRAVYDGTYAQLCVHPDSGDLLGLELSFIPSAAHLHVLLQQAEGDWAPPQLLIAQSSNKEPLNPERLSQALRGAEPLLVSTESEPSPSFRLEPLPGGDLSLHFLDGQRDADGRSTQVRLQRRPPHRTSRRPLALCR